MPHRLPMTPTRGALNATLARLLGASLVIRNQSSIRPAERELNADFRRFHAGCHAANLGPIRPEGDLLQPPPESVGFQSRGINDAAGKAAFKSKFTPTQRQ